ncbi:ABC transporter ATP-binding protein [Kutzneria viridogrisea]|uniref:Cobalt ABC transporter ATP-binding protein n=2 Tax=Kutzneria TaxID=43356 RepID=W5W2G6_9PSEU|nr:ABC transporter ATP-binding protein [Kutzneria albida]AHH95378.1 cobalt ABC transporter ATP-binding protein [Kutzneria albida DSM 43870]MBA8927265.1 energy-coupling factor transport system ATP-binding protein [Kutzneria viridogrisea]
MSIQVEDLHYTYSSGTVALQGVSLSIADGERVAIVGQNGAGKTTLVRHLNGIFRATGGRVLVDGQDLAGREIAELARTVGYVFQNPNEQLFARTVRAEVEFGPRNLGYDRARRDELVDWALTATRLTEHATSHPYHLSLAERKRVAIASVLAMDTPVVVFDEPTTGQDHAGVRDVSEVIAQLHARGRTVIAITHDMDFVAENFDRVVAMAQGRVLADGTVHEVFADAEVVAGAAVEAPAMMRLAQGLGWTESVTTVERFVAVLAR